MAGENVGSAWLEGTNHPCFPGLTTYPIRKVHPIVQLCPDMQSKNLGDFHQPIDIQQTAMATMQANSSPEQRPIPGDDGPPKKRARKERTLVCSWPDCRRVFGKFEHLQRHERSRKLLS